MSEAETQTDSSEISVEEQSILSRREQIEQLKLLIIAHLYLIIYQIVEFLVAAITPLLTIIVLSAIDQLVSPIPVVTISPFGLQLQGNGIPITTFLIAGAVGEMAKRLWRLNSNGWPSAELKEGDEIQ
jgi:hypothetical protein